MFKKLYAYFIYKMDIIGENKEFIEQEEEKIEEARKKNKSPSNLDILNLTMNGFGLYWIIFGDSKKKRIAGFILTLSKFGS